MDDGNLKSTTVECVGWSAVDALLGQGITFLVSLLTNGILLFITALHALHVSGDVITTPYSFVTTTCSFWWNGIKSVFFDIDDFESTVKTVVSLFENQDLSKLNSKDAVFFTYGRFDLNFEVLEFEKSFMKFCRGL